jgi:hypothetical protein
VKRLCLESREILIEEGNVQVVDAPVTVRRAIYLLCPILTYFETSFLHTTSHTLFNYSYSFTSAVSVANIPTSTPTSNRHLDLRLHGQFWDLMELFKVGVFCPDTNYLFMGTLSAFFPLPIPHSPLSESRLSPRSPVVGILLPMIPISPSRLPSMAVVLRGILLPCARSHCRWEGVLRSWWVESESSDDRPGPCF